MNRFAIPSSAVLLLTLVFATPVLAAPPSNDLYAGSTAIASLPFTATVDTTEATTDAVDEELNAQCGAPATEASVWYSFTATSDTGVVVDVTASDYDAGVIVATGSPGAFEFVTCGPGVVAFPAASGVTYSILVFDFIPGAGNGGMLSIAVDEVVLPTIDITVDPTGTFNPQTGSATISGTATCTDASSGQIFVELSQQVGRFTVSGFGFAEVLCDGTPQSWSAEVIGSNGLFKGGRAVAFVSASACGEEFCGDDFEQVRVQLRR